MIKFQSDQEAFIWAQFASAYRCNRGSQYAENVQSAFDAAGYADELLKRWRERNQTEGTVEVEGPYR